MSFSNFPSNECSPQANPRLYQVQVLIPGKIVFNGIVYQIASIDKTDVIKFQSQSLREVWMNEGIYGRLMADFSLHGSRMLEMRIINGKVVHIEEIPDHLMETILAIDAVEDRLNQIAKSLGDAATHTH